MELIKTARPQYSKTGKQKSMAWFLCPICKSYALRQSSTGREQITCGCARMPKPKPKTIIIPCLKCGKPFPSKDKKRNRFCAKCNRDNENECRKSYKHGKTDGRLHPRKGN